MNLDAINNMDELRDLVRAGWSDWERFGDVRVVQHGRLILFNYTQACQFANRWNWFEQQSRGLILDSMTGEVVARPFSKFFNVGEHQHVLTHARLIEATEKMDGSLGILYRNDDKFHIATRGSFTSEQAVWATEYLNTHYNLNDLPRQYTLLFEIIYPENRVIVNYGDLKTLVLIGVRNRESDKDHYFPVIKAVAEKYKFPTPQVFGFKDVGDYLKLAAELDPNHEGWVLRFDDGSRFKVKGDAYRVAARLMNDLSKRRVVEAMAAGKLQQLFEGLPDEFYTEVQQHVQTISYEKYVICSRIRYNFDRAPKQDRRTFALWVQENCPTDDKALMFLMLDSKDIMPLVYKTILQNCE